VTYLLDTNACIALINGTSDAVRSRFDRASRTGAGIFVSSIAIYELWYGVYKSARGEFNMKRVRSFLAGPISLIPFEPDDARSAGQIRAALEASGKPIGAYDILIAGQALSRKLVLVTASISEFSRVKNLEWEDWARP